MRKDELQVKYLSDAERFADFVNGVVFEGGQVISAEDVIDCDTQTGMWRLSASAAAGTKKQRDLLRRIALGANFVIVGIENQEEVHHLMPLRVMSYDVSEYERQALLIRKEMSGKRGLTPAEYLSGFGKESKLMPCVTFVLYYGKDWNGSRDLHGLMDFSGMPKGLVKYVANYPIHLIEVRKFENTDVFKTDLKLVFDFIRYSDNMQKLKEHVAKNVAYKSVDEDAYDMMVAYTNSGRFIGMRDNNEEGGKTDMCKALEDWEREAKSEGRMEGIRGMIFDNIEEGIPAERIVQKLKKYFGLEEDEAGRLIAVCVGDM